MKYHKQRHPYPNTIEEIKQHIKRSIQQNHFSKLDRDIIRIFKQNYPLLTNMQVLTIFWLHRCLELAPLVFEGQTQEEAKDFFKRCKNLEDLKKNPQISQETKHQIGMALQNKMDFFTGNTEEEAKTYLDTYWERRRKGELKASKTELKFYAAESQANEKKHMQASRCPNCQNDTTPCNQCPYYL
jgi:hypothetical protein